MDPSTGKWKGLYGVDLYGKNKFDWDICRTMVFAEISRKMVSAMMLAGGVDLRAMCGMDGTAAMHEARSRLPDPEWYPESEIEYQAPHVIDKAGFFDRYPGALRKAWQARVKAWERYHGRTWPHEWKGPGKMAPHEVPL